MAAREKPLKWLLVDVGVLILTLKVGENETVSLLTAFGFSLLVQSEHRRTRIDKSAQRLIPFGTC